MALIPNRVYVENCNSLRQYSSGFVGLARNDDFHSVGVGEVSQNINDGSRSDGYGQSGELFRHQSSPRSHYTVNHWTSSQNLGQSTMENIETDPQKPDYLSGGNAAACQQMTADHRQWNSGPDDVYKGNKVASHPGGYQQEKMCVPSSSNGYHQVRLNAHPGNANGYHNGQMRPHQQNIIGSHNPKVLTQSEADGDDDISVEGTLEEFDTFCKEWDLEMAVKSMIKLGKKGIHIDLPRYLILIESCGKAKALEEAKAVHQHLITYVSPVKVNIFNQILEMYGKCGLMEDVLNTFNQMPERNLTSWDTMITWFARNGLGEEAIDTFTRFKEAGLKPDGQMFFGVFDACGVLGDVTEGMLHFESMRNIYGIIPSMSHYASIVHMFGSAGYLDGALEFIEKMDVEPHVDVWESLMNISRVQGNIELGDRCAQIVERLDPSHLSKESKAGLVPVKDSHFLKKVKKANPLEHTKHEYRAGDRSHPENDKIYAILRGIKESLKEAGYIPETRFVLHDVDQEGKEEAIMAHSERLACTYALITSPARMPIRIIKNLRVCGDCHNAFKIISKLVGRQVIMRDAKRFHHFENGKCSCNDYW